jgi:hypothetical protein
MSDRWWLVEGVIVEDVNSCLVHKINSLNVDEFKHLFDGSNFIPRGVPFDCMPDWAEAIEFGGVPFDCMPDWAEAIDFGDGRFWFIAEDGKECEQIMFNKCPEAWKGKTFPITDELRRLIDG